MNPLNALEDGIRRKPAGPVTSFIHCDVIITRSNSRGRTVYVIADETTMQNCKGKTRAANLDRIMPNLSNLGYFERRWTGNFGLDSTVSCKLLSIYSYILEICCIKSLG